MDFENIPKDLDTKILKEEIIELNDYKILHQKWNWDGIIGESLIFKKEDVIDLNDNKLKELAEKTGLIKENKINIVRNDKNHFVFVNFNFDYS